MDETLGALELALRKDSCNLTFFSHCLCEEIVGLGGFCETAGVS